MHKFITTICLSLFFMPFIQAEEITMKITKRYLNLPVSHQIERSKMTFTVNEKQERCL